MSDPFPYRDPAESSDASCWPSVAKGPRDFEFLESFSTAYGIQPDDLEELKEWLHVEASRVWTEKLYLLLAVFKDCGIPASVVFVALIQNDNCKLSDLAAECSVSKNAIHKHTINQEPVLDTFGIRNSYRRGGQEVKSKPLPKNKTAGDLMSSLMKFSRDIRDAKRHGLSKSDEAVKVKMLELVQSINSQCSQILNSGKAAKATT